MRQYLDLMRHIAEHGRPKSDRTGTGTLSGSDTTSTRSLDGEP